MAAVGYSARVALKLVVDGVEIALSHVGPNDVIVRDVPILIPPGAEGRLIVSVDGKCREQSVVLPYGISGSGMRVKYF